MKNSTNFYKFILSCYLIFFIKESEAFINNRDKIVHLISDVQKYYKTDSVFIIHSGNDGNWEKTTLTYQLLREFSSKLVLSQKFDYDDVNRYHEIYYMQIKKPLFVVILTSKHDVDSFTQFSLKLNMSHVMWLVIFTNFNLEMCRHPNRNYFNLNYESEMLVRCDDDPNVSEWFSIHGTETNTYNLATWDLVHRFQLNTDKTLYERRNNLMKKELKAIAVKESIAFHLLKLNDVSGTILEELSRMLNFRIKLMYTDHYGTYDKKRRKWSGAVGKMMSGDIDFSMTELAQTVGRSKVLDFSLPTRRTRSVIYIRRPEVSVLNYSAYFRVYTIDVWIALKVTLIISCVSITFIKMKSEKFRPSNYVSENCLRIWGIFTQQGMTDFPTALSMKIAYSSLLFNSVIIYSIYSACLISYLTLTNVNLPFNTVEEFAKDKSYKLIVLYGTADHDIIKHSTDMTMQEIRKLMPDEEQLPTTLEDSFRMVCESKMAFYMMESIEQYIKSRISCDVVSFDADKSLTLGITLKKKSVYKNLINHYMLKFQDTGILNRIRKKIYEKVSPAENTYNPVGYENVLSLFLLLLLSILLSVIILGYEIVIYRYVKIKKNRKLIPVHKKDIYSCNQIYNSRNPIRIKY